MCFAIFECDRGFCSKLLYIVASLGQYVSQVRLFQYLDFVFAFLHGCEK